MRKVAYRAGAMVMRWGMSDKVGNIDSAEAHEGYNGSTGGFSISAATKELSEQEVRDLIEQLTDEINDGVGGRRFKMAVNG